MKASSIIVFALFSCAQAFSTNALAADSGARENSVKSDTAEVFAATAKEVRAQMAIGGRYEFIRPDEKSKADSDLNAMSAMFDKYGSVAAMSQPEKVQLFNYQENLNGILTHSDRNRLICEHRPPMGSNIAVTMCKTVAEIEKMRRDGQKMAQDGTSIGWTCLGGKPGTGCAPKGGG